MIFTNDTKIHTQKPPIVIYVTFIMSHSKVEVSLTLFSGNTVEVNPYFFYLPSINLKIKIYPQ